ncbi:hypothetical protein, partial [Pantoea sp. GbtcB22]|uniref:hypothetical protein n=1 Tax=Pantoea sp. GbtcB22 TaxID=2824767 RepID=UPI001C307BB2
RIGKIAGSLVDKHASFIEAVEINIGAGDAGMTEEALEFLQRVSDDTTIGGALLVGVRTNPAKLRADQKREHMDRKYVPQHVRRQMDVQAVLPTPRFGSREDRLP